MSSRASLFRVYETENFVVVVVGRYLLTMTKCGDGSNNI
jgi:hypothetical protein